MRIPTRYLISNVFVAILGGLMILLAGAFWIPESRMPALQRKLKGQHRLRALR